MTTDLVEQLRATEHTGAWLDRRAADELEDRAARIAELERENEKLKTMLANSNAACVYCELPKAEWAKCAHGFPGCPRGDDAVQCPHVGAALEADERIVLMREVLDRCEDYFEKRADAEYFTDSPFPHGNEEMTLLVDVREALK